jgi:hypothetical protein
MTKSNVLDLLIGAVVKLDAASGERENVLAFIQSCYGGRVRSYDLEAASESLTKLTEEEQHALITWVLLNTDNSVHCRVRVRF